MRRLARVFATALVLTGLCTSVAVAQDTEPNNTCAAVAASTPSEAPVFFFGRLDKRDATATSDVDFFAFNGLPGQRLVLSVDSIGGVFDEQCRLIARNRAFLEPRIEFAVPASGRYAIGVAALGDLDFTGVGFQEGGYSVSVEAAPTFVSSISGRVVDAHGGFALPGTVQPNTEVVLEQCFFDCTELARQRADAQGRFRIERDRFGDPLPTQNLQLTVAADRYKTAELALAPADGEQLDLGDVALEPPAIVFSDVKACDPIPVEGGRCEYSAVIRNTTDVRFIGQALSTVDGFGPVSFEASASRTGSGTVRRAALDIPPGGAHTVRFAFDVPRSFLNGEQVCARLDVGFDPFPLFNSAGEVELFCVRKQRPTPQVAEVAALALAESEPNGTCLTPEPRGVLALPSTLEGTLDAENAAPRTDVDFFRFAAAPGARLRLGLESERAGVFDDQCNLIQALNGGFRVGLEFEVPANGRFLLAVANSSDEQFSGEGFFTQARPYKVEFAAAPDFVRSISGRLVDAKGGFGLAGSTEPRALVSLRACGQGPDLPLPCAVIATQRPDADGRFRFELDAESNRLPVGNYFLISTANGYPQFSFSSVINVAANEDGSFGNVPLESPTIAFGNVSACSDVPAQGGTCRYSAVVHNNGAAAYAGLAHSMVTRTLGHVFEASARPRGRDVQRASLAIPAGGSQELSFSFEVPSFLDPGETACAQLYVGSDPEPLFDTARVVDLFCVIKERDGLRLLGPDESRPRFDALREAELGKPAEQN
jgi:hypothetical protein